MTSLFERSLGRIPNQRNWTTRSSFPASEQQTERKAPANVPLNELVGITSPAEKGVSRTSEISIIENDFPPQPHFIEVRIVAPQPTDPECPHFHQDLADTKLNGTPVSYKVPLAEGESLVLQQ